MYFSKTFAISFAFSLALAADHVPVTIENLDPGFNVVCGGTTVAGRDVYNSVAWGMSLNESDEQLKASGANGRLYPSVYGNSEGFQWISNECNQAPSEALQHMPIVKGGFFEEGGDAGLYRSVYWYNYDTDVSGHPKGWYCGTIYHIGNNNGYAGCDVTM